MSKRSGRTVATCGHKLTDRDRHGVNIGYHIALAEWETTEHGIIPVVSWEVYCLNCRNEAKRSGMILDTEGKREYWMRAGSR